MPGSHTLAPTSRGQASTNLLIGFRFVDAQQPLHHWLSGSVHAGTAAGRSCQSLQACKHATALWCRLWLAAGGFAIKHIQHAGCCCADGLLVADVSC